MTAPQSAPTPRDRSLSGAPNESTYGYCRAVKLGDRVIVSGTTATVPGGGVDPAHEGDTYAQAREALRRIGAVLDDFGLGFEHVVKTTVFFTVPTAVGDVVRAHGEVFADIKPASTAVGVSGLFSPSALVEIEAEAVA